MLVDEIKVIDADSHITEPPDLWTSRVGKELLELAPRVMHDEKRNFDRWWIGEKRLGGVAASAAAGWPEPLPSYPPTLAEAHPGSWNPVERLKVLEEYGVWAQVLYPNLVGFQQYAFLALPEPLRSECVRAYNDFLIDFSSEAPDRLIPIMFAPYWDLEFCLAEVKRCAAVGHKGVLFPSAFEKQGLPMLSDGYWDPFYALCQDLGLSINFHTAFQSLMLEEELRGRLGRKRAAGHPAIGRSFRESTQSDREPMRCVQEVLTSGVCDRFPTLKFVAVESGVGWMVSEIETLEASWAVYGGDDTFRGQSSPSECFYRQVYGTYMQENQAVMAVAEILQDNIMFSTDFPHPGSLAPGPFSPSADAPREVIERLSTLPREVATKLLRTNAARVYGIE